jgi:hypothetical protein
MKGERSSWDEIRIKIRDERREKRLSMLRWEWRSGEITGLACTIIAYTFEIVETSLLSVWGGGMTTSSDNK